MPLGEIAGEALGGLFRFVGRIFVEILFEGLIKGTGYAIVSAVRPKTEPEDALCSVVGLLFWLAVGLAAYCIYWATAG